MDELELRKFSLQMAMAPVLSDPEPINISFNSIVDAAITFEHYLKTGEIKEDDELVDNLDLVKE